MDENFICGGCRWQQGQTEEKDVGAQGAEEEKPGQEDKSQGSVAGGLSAQQETVSLVPCGGSLALICLRGEELSLPPDPDLLVTSCFLFLLLPLPFCPSLSRSR